jgi:hypothetical protein
VLRQAAALVTTLLVIVRLEPDVEFQLLKAVSMSIICPEVNPPLVGDTIYRVTDAPFCQPAPPPTPSQGIYIGPVGRSSVPGTIHFGLY